MRKLVLVSLAAFLLSSCSKEFYQMYTTEAPNLKEVDRDLVYENEDCKITYNLWSESGNSGFIFYNKTDRDLFIVLPQTFLIKNGFAFDYYQNREYTASKSLVSNSISGASASWNTWYGIANIGATSGDSKSISSSMVTKEMPIICVPPKAYKLFSEYIILGKIIRNCDKSQMFPKKSSIPFDFSKEDSPLVFSNRIAYSYSSDGDDCKFVENEFWISKLVNYAAKEAGKMVLRKDCENDFGVEKYKFNDAAPNRFYNSYKGITPVDGKSKGKGKLVDWWY